MTAQDISVVICAHTEERWEQLVCAVESLECQSVAPREILVVIDHNMALANRVYRRLPSVRDGDPPGSQPLSANPRDADAISRTIAEVRPASTSSGGRAKPLGFFALVAEGAAAALASALLGGFVVMLYGYAAGRAAAPGLEVRSWAAIALGQIVLGAFVAWRARRRFGSTWRAAIGLRGVALDCRLVGRIAMALGLYWTWAVLVIAVFSFGGGLPSPPDLAPRSAAGLGTFVLTAGVLAPLCEEAFFRGYLQTRARAFLSPRASVALPALLFGLAHFNGSFIQPAVVVMLGVLAGWLRYATASLVPGMILHALSNGCLIAVVVLAR